MRQACGLVAIAVTWCVGVAAVAQDRPGAPRPTGTREWLVIKGSLQDFTGKSDTRVADFDTEAEAVKEATRLNTAEVEWTKWTYVARRRAQDDPAPSGPVVPDGPRGAPIKQPDLKFVDPGAMRKDDPKVPSLAGRTGTGTIGTATVTLTFTGDAAGGEFVVAGEMKGKGRWRQLGKHVLMETNRSAFAGALDGDTLAGTRRAKESGEKDGWSIRLSGAAGAGGLVNSVWVYRGSPVKRGGYSGIWIYEQLMVFLPDGRFVQLRGDTLQEHFRQDGRNAYHLGSIGKWTSDGSGLVRMFDVVQSYAQDRVLPGTAFAQVKGDAFMRGVMKGDTFEPFTTGEMNRLQRASERVTREALERAREAKW